MTLYSWGANSHGQLGIGFQSDQEILPKVVKTNDFDVKKIRMIKGGGGHTLVLDDFNDVFSCGWNNKGQLGIANSYKDQYYFQNVNTYTKFSSISCGWENSGGISLNGEVHLWGLIDTKPYIKPIKLLLPNYERAKQLEFGLRFGCVLTETNTLYIFGKSKCLSIIQALNITETCSVMGNEIELFKINLEKIPVKIACGQNHIVVLTSDNQLLMYGDNRYGQCGNGSPDFLSIKHQITNLCSGWTHSGYLTDNKDVFLWGRNNYGQLGSAVSENLQIIYHPNKLAISVKIAMIYLGSEHGMVISDSGKVYTWGWNEHGNCGSGTTENIYSPCLIELNGRCKLGGTGAGFCYALSDN